MQFANSAVLQLEWRCNVILKTYDFVASQWCPIPGPITAAGQSRLALREPPASENKKTRSKPISDAQPKQNPPLVPMAHEPVSGPLPAPETAMLPAPFIQKHRTAKRT
jgi:hypothetical protein